MKKYRYTGTINAYFKGDTFPTEITEFSGFTALKALAIIRDMIDAGYTKVEIVKFTETEK